MAATVPASLKTADITRFAFRAAQLEQAKPIVAYWCDYWIVNQILTKQLHNADQESLVYTTTMMDKLEKFKSQHAEETAVTDDVAGKAYVEQFGLETFERADNAVRADKASRQTADTFQAAATFLDLLAIWGAIEPEITAKIKYGKYHALRIAKAIKNGEDPNDSNPQPAESEQLPELDPNDAEVQALEGGGRPRQPSVAEVPDEADKIQKRLAQTSSFDQSLHPSRDASTAPNPRQPSVIEAPDDTDRLQAKLARTSTQDESLHPSRAPSAPPHEGISPIEQDPASYYNDSDKAPVSPLDPPTERKPSLGGNYFPEVPPSITQSPTSATAGGSGFPSIFHTNSIPPPAPPHHHGRSIDEGPPPPAARQPHGPVPPPPPTQYIPPPIAGPPPVAPLSPPIVPPQIYHKPAPLHHPTAPIPTPSQPASWSVPKQVAEEDVISAQKHCRWAISALNFEDVPTAIKELRSALQDLGGL